MGNKLSKYLLLFCLTLISFMSGLFIIHSQVEAAVVNIQATYHTTSDGGDTTQSTSNNGTDDNTHNGVVRSFDNITITPVVNFRSTTGDDYQINFQIAGTIGGGVNDGVLNAEFARENGGAYNLATGSSYMTSATQSVNTANGGSWPATPITIRVFGATNGTVLKPTFKVQVTSIIDETTEQSVAVTPGSLDTAFNSSDGLSQYRVSSQTSIGVQLTSKLTFIDSFSNYTKNTASGINGNIGSFGYDVGLVPLPGRSDFLGAAYPAPGKPITIDFSSNISQTNNNTAGNDPIKLFQTGPIATTDGASGNLTLTPGYASYSQTPDNLFPVPELPFSSYAAAGNYVNSSVQSWNFHSGDITGANPGNTDDDISITFSNWQTNDTFPQNAQVD